MNTKITRIALTSIFLLGAVVVANAQDSAPRTQTAPQRTQKTPKPAPPAAPVPKPVAFATAAKLTVAKLKISETEAYDVRGKITYTVTAANSDDTVAGTMNYTIPDDARQKIAAITGKPLNSVPQSITRKDIVAGFQKLAAPPIIHLEINPMDIDVLGANVHFNRIVLDVNARDSIPTELKFTNDEIEVLFTIWARQIANGRPRRGIISAMNKRIAGEDDN